MLSLCQRVISEVTGWKKKKKKKKKKKTKERKKERKKEAIKQLIIIYRCNK